MKKMQEMKVKKMLPLLTLLALAIGGGFVLAQFILTKPYSSTGQIITSADFKIYSDVACTQEITTFALGDMKRGIPVTKAFYLKFIVAPEENAKIKWTIQTPDTNLDITAKFYTDIYDSSFPMPPNTQSGTIYVLNTINKIGKYEIIFTPKTLASLSPVNPVINLTAEPSTG